MSVRRFLRSSVVIWNNVRVTPSAVPGSKESRALLPTVCMFCRLYSQHLSSPKLELDQNYGESQEEPEFSNRDDTKAEPKEDEDSAVEQTEYGEPVMWDRRIPRDLKDFRALARRPQQQLPNPKYLRVSIIGAPNAGKSTLTNQIIGWRVCSVSAKVHTTRRNTLAVMTEDNVQIVLVDTPGAINAVHGKKHRLERSLIVDPAASLQAVDVVAVMVDVSNRYAKVALDPLLLHMLYNNPHMESILILNKVDKVKKKSELLETSRLLTAGFVDSMPVQRFMPIERHLTKTQRFQLFQERHDGLREGLKSPEDKFWEEAEAYGKMEKWDEKKRFIEQKAGWPRFKEVFMISALDGDGVSELKSTTRFELAGSMNKATGWLTVLEDEAVKSLQLALMLMDSHDMRQAQLFLGSFTESYFMRSAYSSEWRFNPNLVSNQSPKEIVLMAVREKLLDNLRLKLPYQIQLFLTQWDVNERGTLCLTVRLKCPRQGAMKHVVGENGKRVREIAYEAGQELMNTFRCEVLLKLIVSY